MSENSRIYAEIVSDCSVKTLQEIIRDHVDIENVVHPDGWKGCDGLVDGRATNTTLLINKSQDFASMACSSPESNMEI